MNRNSSTRPATAAEQMPVLTPLPPARLPVIDYREQPFAPGRFFIEVESPLGLTWTQHGTQLRSTVSLRGIPHLVEVDTAMGGDDIDAAATSVGIFDTRSFPHRYIEEVDEMVAYYDVLRDAADAEVQRRATGLIEAHEELRDEQAAERAIEFEESLGL
jgi:hypothetical protein